MRDATEQFEREELGDGCGPALSREEVTEM